MDLTWNSITAANETLKRWRNKISTWSRSSTTSIDPEMEAAFNNDLDTPKVILRLRDIEKGNLENKGDLFRYADQVLGLDLDRPAVARTLTAQMQQILDERMKARSEKRWADSDALRVQLENLGLHIKDTADGQSWS